MAGFSPTTPHEDTQFKCFLLANYSGPKLKAVALEVFTGHLAQLVAELCAMYQIQEPDDYTVQVVAEKIQDGYGYLTFEEIRLATDLAFSKKLPGAPAGTYGRIFEWLTSVLSAYCEFRTESIPAISRRLPPREDATDPQKAREEAENEFWERCVKLQYDRYCTGQDLTQAQLPEIFQALQEKGYVFISPERKRELLSLARAVAEADMISKLQARRTGRPLSEVIVVRKAMEMACYEAFKQIREKNINLNQ